MKHYPYDGIDFVTDLVWQQVTPQEKMNLKLYREDCQFDFYCKTNKLGSTYGFGRLPRDGDGNLILKLKNPLSLALYIVNSVDIEAEKGVNLFICFRFDNSYGYVFLYNGSILPEDGEFIGSLEEVKARIKSLSKQYNAKAAFVPDDVPFYNDAAFEFETGLKIYVLKSHVDEATGEITPASKYIFWSNHKHKKYSSRIISLDTRRQKKLIVLFASILFLAITGAGVKSYFFPDLEIEDVGPVIKKVAPESYPAKIFIDTCLSKFNKLAINTTGWQVVSYKCTANNIEVIYKSDNGQLQELQNLVGTESLVFNQNGATLKSNIAFTEQLSTPAPIKDSLPQQVDDLHSAAEKLGFTVNVVTNKVDISSGYSPVFLYDNNIINQLNLSGITMTADATGFMSWKIIGEINAK